MFKRPQQITLQLNPLLAGMFQRAALPVPEPLPTQGDIFDAADEIDDDEPGPDDPLFADEDDDPLLNPDSDYEDRMYAAQLVHREHAYGEDRELSFDILCF